MALRKDYINENGETIQNCYWKIGADDGIIGGKHMFNAKLYCYENQTKADLNQDELFIHEFEFLLDMGRGDDIIKQAYDEIKQQFDFEDAVDI